MAAQGQARTPPLPAEPHGPRPGPAGGSGRPVTTTCRRQGRPFHALTRVPDLFYLGRAERLLSQSPRPDLLCARPRYRQQASRRRARTRAAALYAPSGPCAPALDGGETGGFRRAASPSADPAEPEGLPEPRCCLPSLHRRGTRQGPPPFHLDPIPARRLRFPFPPPAFTQLRSTFLF